ncbi:MAG: FG-GAP-like repeat-containing protein, partial [Tannerella sp.]|nr:FG-GAP-like repeat-containing protein [Tannerella sp.]
MGVLFIDAKIFPNKRRNGAMMVLLAILSFVYTHAQGYDAQMAVTATASKLNPKSGEAFEFNIVMGSQGLGSTASIISNARVDFDLPPHLDVVATPMVDADAFIITMSSDTHVNLRLKQGLPVGIVRSFKFMLQYEPGVSVQNVDNYTINVTASGDNCLPQTANSGNINPQNDAMPQILSAYTEGDTSSLHTAIIKVRPEALVGGLNHNNAQVRIAIDKDAAIQGIKLGDTFVSVSPTIVGDSAIYYIPLGLLEVEQFPAYAEQVIKVFYAYPPNVACPAPSVPYDMTISYFADREAGATDTPVSESLTMHEELRCTNSNSAPVVQTAMNFQKSHYKANELDYAVRGEGKKLNYYINLTPHNNLRNVVIIDDPASHEADFFVVNRFIGVTWTADDSDLSPVNNPRVKMRISYQTFDNPGIWVTPIATPSYSGSLALDTTYATHVTHIRIEYFADDGVTTVIPALSGKAEVTLNAVMTPASENTSYISDNLLNNSAYIQADIHADGEWETVVQDGVANRIQSDTPLKNAKVHSYLANAGFYYSRPQYENTADPMIDIPFSVWGIFGGYPVTSMALVGEEIWYKCRFDVEVEACRDMVLMFYVTSSDFEVVQAVGGYGVGDFAMELFPVPSSGGTVVKLTLNGQHRRGNGYPYSPNNPFEADGWGPTGQYYGCTDVGIKLKVLPGATETIVYFYTGTTNFEQGLAPGDWGGGYDYFGGGVAAEVITAFSASGAFAAQTGEYWAFQGTNSTLKVDDAIGLHPEKTASTDGVNFSQSAIFNNITATQTIYYKLYLKNTTSGATTYDRIKMLDMLPGHSDPMALNDVSKGSTTALQNISIHSIKYCDGTTPPVTVSLPSSDIDIYFTHNATVGNNKAELQNVTGTPPASTAWTNTDTEANHYAIPDTANAIKVDIVAGLPVEGYVEVVIKADMPASPVRQVAWNTFGVGAHATALNIAPVEPAKSGVLRTFGDRKISGVIWYDPNYDGIRQTAETGRYAGTLVALCDSINNLIITTVTDMSGYYEFPNIEANNRYIVKFAIPDTLRLSPYNQGGNDAVDCDFALWGDTAITSIYVGVTDIVNLDAGLDDIPQLEAVDDGASTLVGQSVNIPFLANDMLYTCTSSSVTVTEVYSTSAHGVWTVNFLTSPYTLSYQATSEGADTLRYRLQCGGSTSEAVVKVAAIGLPDNISDLECLTPIDSSVWSIQLQYLTETVEAQTSTAVGDLDGDGKPEIIAYKAATTSCYIDSIVIFWGDDRVNHVTKFRISQSNTNNEMTSDRANAIPTIAKVNMNDGTMKHLIFVPLNNTYIRAFDTAGVVVWTSDVPVNMIQGSSSILPATPPNITDFDGDGLQEIYIGNQVWAAESGRLLATGPAGGNAGRSMASDSGNKYRSLNSIAADLDGDGIVDLAAGTHVYSVTVQDRSGLSSSNRITYKDTIPATLCGVNNVLVRDGRTIVADVNRDGLLDVIVNVSTDTIGSATGATARAGNMGILIWTPQTHQVVATASIARGTDPGGVFLPSPFLVGDIDGGGDIELVCVLHHRVGGWKYNGTTALQRVWTLNLSESSGCTGLTLFDFNSDGVAEIVYRDETTLRVMHPSGSTFTDLMRWSGVNSATYLEFPVIADIDGTGTSAVLVTGVYTASGIPNQATSGRGTLCILRSAGEPWAKARKVWNQYSYNNVNIHEDLTVPRFYFNPATFLPGPNGTDGDADDVQPYNNYLQQQSMLDYKGIKVWPSPDAHFIDIVSKQHYQVGDSLVIVVRVTNTGDALLASPVAISAYKGITYSAVNHIVTDTVYYADIAAGDTVTLRIAIPNVSALSGVSNITLRINDNGAPQIIHHECDTLNNMLQLPLLLAFDDYYQTSVGKTINLPFLNNDFLDGCTALTVSVQQAGSQASATAGTWTPSFGDSPPALSYTATAEGSDTLKYIITCNGEQDSAVVHINVFLYPDNVNDTAWCYGTPPVMDWGIRVAWTSDESDLSSRMNPLVGDLDGDGIPEIVAFTQTGVSSTNDPRAFAIYKYNTSLSRFQRNKEITLPTGATVSVVDPGSWGLVKPSATDSALIVVFTEDYTMRAYTFGGQLKWSTANVVSAASECAATIGFADFNGDGVAEIYLRNKIYNAATGVLLATASGGSNTGSTWTDWTHGTSKYNRKLSAPTVADMNGDNRLDLLLGNEIYDVNITNTAGTGGNSVTRILQCSPPSAPNHTVPQDGHAQPADFNNDGYLDVLITNRNSDGFSGYVSGYIWDVHNNTVSQPFELSTGYTGLSIPLIADLDNDKRPDILLQCAIGGTSGSNAQPNTRASFIAYNYNPASKTFTKLWDFVPAEDSYSNGATMFNFNQDSINEVLIEDQQEVRILKGADGVQYTGANLHFAETTCMQYPLIVDVDADGSADIVAVGIAYTGTPPTNPAAGTLNIFKAATTPWAPTRTVMNQYMYNPVYVNSDLTVPTITVNQAVFYSGHDGLPGTADDVQPYNNFLVQPTIFNRDGEPLWLLPDARIDTVSSAFTYFADKDSVSLHLCIANDGNEPLTNNVYISVYKDTIDLSSPPLNPSSSSLILTDSILTQIHIGDTLCLNIAIPNVSSLQPFVRFVVRINDKYGDFPHQRECETGDSAAFYLNPDMTAMMRKDAVRNPSMSPPDYQAGRGTYPNPVAVLGGDEILYQIRATNANLNSSSILVIDTIPAHLDVISSVTPPLISINTVPGTPTRKEVKWLVTGLAPMQDTLVSVLVQPVSGSVASQPLFVNNASMKVPYPYHTGDNLLYSFPHKTTDSLRIVSNSTYHQGAGVAVVTFSASIGGSIFNAEPQAVDFKTAPRNGVVIAPDEGYEFAGWSHPAYISMRGIEIPATEGVMNYDTLKVYGNVELTATFRRITDPRDSLSLRETISK